MKLTSFFILAALLKTYAGSYSQDKKFSLEYDQIPLAKVIEDIESDSEFRFLFDVDNINIKRQVSIKVRNKNIHSVLKKLFTDTGITYTIDNRQIVLLKKPFTANIAGLGPPQTVAVLQEFLITGTVVDQEGVPLPGANVLEKGTTNGVQTDFDGKFTLNVSNGSAILAISYVGFAPQEIPLDGRSQLQITLQEDASALDEVVVIAYGTTKKSNLTAAVQMVDTKLIENRPVRTVPEMLEGAVPGLNVNLNSGAPDAKASLNIRGFTGLNSSQSPLIMVDGVEQDINSLNPNDIESISVLKDAAASAIYGSRAPFGVVIITTKKGKKGAPLRVDYAISSQFNSPFMLPSTQNSLDFVLDMNRAFYNSGQTAGFYPDSTIENIKRYLNGEIPNNSRIGERTGDGNRQWEAHSYAHGNSNYVGEAFKKTSYNVNQNLSVSGGTEDISYYVGLGKNSKEGIYATDLDQFTRYNVSLRIDASIKKWLSFGANVRYANINTTRPNYRGASDSNGSDGNLWNNISYFPNVPIKNPDGNYHWLSAFPVLEGLAGSFENTEDQLWLIPSLKITPAEHWTVNFQYARNLNTDEEMITTKEVYVDPGDGSLRRSGRSANYNDISRNNGRRSYYQLDGNIGYDNKFGKHNVLGLVGAQQEFNSFRKIFANRRDLYSLDYPVLGNAYGDSFSLDERYYEWATRGFYGRFSYNYDDRYLIDFNGRYDGSSRFQRDTRWSFLPSISAGYNVANESFWPFKEFINAFKITGSWGKLGNQLLDLNGNDNTNDLADLYTYIPVFNTFPRTNAVLGGSQQPYVTMPELVRSDVTWEKPESIGFGLETALFDNQLKAEYQWYQRTTYDALGVAEQLPIVLGTGVPLANNAVIETRGWELSLDWHSTAFKSSDQPLRYGIRGTLSDYVGYVLQYGPGNESGLRNDTWTRGQVFGQVWGYESQGIAQNTSDLQNWIPASNGFYYPGDMFYKDLDGDGIISSGSEEAWYALGDTKVLGYNYPRYRYSIYLDAGWKGFGISVLLDGVGKESVWANNKSVFGHSSRDSWASRTAYEEHNDLGYWRADNTNAFFPRIYRDGKNTDRINDRYLINLANLRIKNINLTYNFPREITDMLHLYKMGFNLSMENVGFIYNRSWLKLDPALLRQGVIGYPLSQVVSLGFNVGF